MIEVYLFDWGDTLMVEFPGVSGKMCDWEKVAAVDGATEALACLSQQARIYVASGANESDEGEIASALRRVNLDRYISGYFCRANLGVAKGRPAFLLKILSLLKLGPEQVTIVGNSLAADIEPALAIGMRAIWLCTDQIVSPPEGVRVIDGLRELCGETL